MLEEKRAIKIPAGFLKRFESTYELNVYIPIY